MDTSDFDSVLSYGLQAPETTYMFFNYQLDLGFQQLMATRFVSKPVVKDHDRVHDEQTVSIHPYQELVHHTSLVMKQVYARELKVEPSFKLKKSLNGRFSLSSYSWELVARRKSIATVRMVYIQGQKMEIVNSWIFPKRPDRMPVLAAELISVNEVTRVAFVDVQVPGLSTSHRDEVEFLTAPLASRFSVLPCDESPPSWATDASQGNYTYARQADSSWTSTIVDCYCSYLDNYLNMYAVGATSREIANLQPLAEITAKLSSYQEHHMTHSPGGKFLSNLFGAEWTQSFLTNFVFAKP